jgi:hypothetical protein
MSAAEEDALAAAIEGYARKLEYIAEHLERA